MPLEKSQFQVMCLLTSGQRSHLGFRRHSTKAAFSCSFLDKLVHVQWRSGHTDFVTEGVSFPLCPQFPLSGGLRFQRAELS